MRIRPPIQEDYELHERIASQTQVYNCIRPHADTEKLSMFRIDYDEREFGFDYVLPESADQTQTYEAVAADVVADVMRGFNGTVMAYGQTGTGKTFTIFGNNRFWDKGYGRPKMPDWTMDDIQDLAAFEPSASCGVVCRALHQIFSHIQDEQEHTEFRVMVSFLQLYMENLTDLLAPEKSNLTIREDPKTGVYVENLSQVIATSVAEVLYLIAEGVHHRATSSTLMNATSSRSHVVLKVTVERSKRNKANSTPSAGAPQKKIKRGTLTIIDLAGSERVSKSGSEGLRLEEAKKINKSICALGNCIASLADKSCTHVAFRDSKLTRLLTHSLSGNCKTAICATLNPLSIHFDESFSTCLFASRAMAVNTKASVNEALDFTELPIDKQVFENAELSDMYAGLMKSGLGKDKGNGKGRGRSVLGRSALGNKGINESDMKSIKKMHRAEGSSYSLIYCFQKALHKSGLEIQTLTEECELKEQAVRDATLVSDKLASEMDSQADACKKAEEAVAQLSHALLATKLAANEKESKFEQLYLAQQKQMQHNEADYKAQLQAQSAELETLKRKLADKEKHDGYRIII